MTECDVCEVSPMNKDWMGVAMHVGQACYSYKPNSVVFMSGWSILKRHNLHCTHLVNSGLAPRSMSCCMFYTAGKIALSNFCSHANLKRTHVCCQPLWLRQCACHTTHTCRHTKLWQ